MKYTIKFYQDGSGKRPIREWLDSIKDYKTKSILLTRIDRLEQGNFGKCEPVGNGISELKIYYGPGYRIYFSKVGSICILLLCGGDKSSQKDDIAKAKAYFEDWELEEAKNDKKSFKKY